MGKFLFTLILIFTIPFTVCSESDSSNSDSVYLHKLKVGSSKGPRNYGNTCIGIRCIISSMGIYFEIPEECDFLEVEILQERIVYFNGIITPDEPMLNIHDLSGEINIICKTDVGDIYRGFVQR